MGFDRSLRISLEDRAETRFDVLAQAGAGVDLLARNGQSHDEFISSPPRLG